MPKRSVPWRTRSRELPGVRAAVAFNSGHGARTQSNPGEPCGSEALRATFAQYGSVHSHVPVLWIQTEGDRSFSLANARSWFGAFFVAGGRGAFRTYPASHEDSHDSFALAPAQWRETVHDFFVAEGLRP